MLKRISSSSLDDHREVYISPNSSSSLKMLPIFRFIHVFKIYLKTLEEFLDIF